MIEYENGNESKQEFQFLAMGVSEKAQWMADIAQVAMEGCGHRVWLHEGAWSQGVILFNII